MHHLVDILGQSYEKQRGINHVDGLNLPTTESVVEIIRDFFRIIFPGFIGNEAVTTSSVRYYVGSIIEQLYDKCVEQITRALKYQCTLNKCDECDCEWRAKHITEKLLQSLPENRRLLKLDVEAAYDGDPAAKSLDEIIMAYPFIKAITVHRIAHILYTEQVPLIPRIMNEWTHSETAIDIHPGANVGESFFIDHGSGVVIGETTEIGNNVKIYQGVTLGALSFSKDERGKMIRGTKRHPTLKDNVTVYANATILGGHTVIGKNVVIGGNTWITESVEPDTVVTISNPELCYRKNGECGSRVTS
ncbi:MAG: serine acetyltransferase [Spirochaetales bacterium]|nr:serine acetyltransferase [Spirochaetales bacterium]